MAIEGKEDKIRGRSQACWEAVENAAYLPTAELHIISYLSYLTLAHCRTVYLIWSISSDPYLPTAELRPIVHLPLNAAVLRWL